MNTSLFVYMFFLYGYLCVFIFYGYVIAILLYIFKLNILPVSFLCTHILYIESETWQLVICFRIEYNNTTPTTSVKICKQLINLSIGIFETYEPKSSPSDSMLHKECKSLHFASLTCTKMSFILKKLGQVLCMTAMFNSHQHYHTFNRFAYVYF